MIDMTYKNMLIVIIFVYMLCYIKDLLNNRESLNYFKEKLKIFVIGSNSSFINSNFFKVIMSNYIINILLLHLYFLKTKYFNDSSNVFEEAVKSNENQILGFVMGSLGVAWNCIKVIILNKNNFLNFKLN
jgi:hypothetical protein